MTYNYDRRTANEEEPLSDLRSLTREVGELLPEG